MTSKGSRTRLTWEGDSQKEIRSWPKTVRENVGNDLSRLERDEPPLDGKFMGNGLYELRDEEENVQYRVLYAMNAGWIYVLHCFIKKTEQTPPHDLQLAQKRREMAVKRNDPPYKEPEPAAKGQQTDAKRNKRI